MTDPTHEALRTARAQLEYLRDRPPSSFTQEMQDGYRVAMVEALRWLATLASPPVAGETPRIYERVEPAVLAEALGAERVDDPRTRAAFRQPPPPGEPAPVVFTCSRCGEKGNPPRCDHFQQPWSIERIAEVYRAITAHPPGEPPPATVAVQRAAPTETERP